MKLSTLGKTTFLCWLLLYRLERRLPTAVQFRASSFIYFSANLNGASLRVLDAHSSGRDLSLQCWALSNANDDVAYPARVFLYLNIV